MILRQIASPPRWFSYVTPLLLASLLSSPAFVTPPVESPLAVRHIAGPASLDRDFELLDALAMDLVAAAKLPGLSVAILQDGELAFARGYGSMDLQAGTPVTMETRFRCASVSKAITATALAKLVQEGRLDLDAPVTRYVPTWPESPVITPRQLAGHLAGVAHYQPHDRIERTRHYDSVTEALGVFRDSPRAGDPGEAYTYSTHGFTLLSAVIEGASGLPFLDYLEREIFGPLGMTGSGPDLRAAPSPHMSTLYGRRGGEPVRIPHPEDPSYKWAGGGLVSTPADLVRMADAYMNGFLAPGIVAEWFESQRTVAGDETGVGIAWRIGEDRVGRRVIHHSGSMGGARTTLVIVPDERLAIAVMTNIVWRTDIKRTAELLLDAFRVAAPDRDGRFESDRARGAAALGTMGETGYTGTFAGEEASGTVHLEGGTGRISMPVPYKRWAEPLAVDRMMMRHLSDDTYLLITPGGLVDLYMEREGARIRGEAQVTSTRAWIFETVPEDP